MNSWTMHAQVADRFCNRHGNVFLAGDAAHRFPPAGATVGSAVVIVLLSLAVLT